MEPPPVPLTTFLLAGLDPLTATALVVIVLLLIVSAAMSASEVALFSLDPTQLRDLRERGGRSGTRVIDLLSKPRRLLATILIANNFVNVGVIILSTIVLNGLVDTTGMSDLLVFSIQVLGVTLVILLLGEVLPKVYATSHAMRVATTMAAPLTGLRWVLSPLNELLVRSTTFIEKRYKKKAAKGISVDSLGHALELTNDASTTAEEQRILKGIVKFGSVEVSEVMRPRTAMVAFDKELTFQELVPAIIESGFSRVPVYEGTLDRVIGVLHIKDVLPFLDKPDMDWLAHLHEPCFVPETKKLDDMLKEFQRKKVHLAIVVDEYGGTSGLVTLEDVIEEIVGDITDEFDDEELNYTKLDDRTWVFEGRTPLNDLYRILGIDGRVFEENRGDSGTVGGFVLELTGRIPQKGERVSLRNFTFVVESSDNKRVRRVKISVGDEAAA
ncbi:MAG: gliding motility-associated protein GldE [Flavobacteriales bacterium]|jgi:gliding motility-associated protein GldE|nr:gliding motility-associated protein GldE [Flavobacteriales bacterium]MBK7942498.1 gliding motility-associated protein GldE [Flavobacteriales bacterium]MBK8948316.1 gliding motility-associated protein GldE [Flavobacteriales bacterium]MBK9699102.1 gliding motility-associated protein GldE [Flavobacteriales bacterium]